MEQKTPQPVKKKTLKFKLPHFHRGTGPAADWKIIFLSAAALIVILTLINTFVYFSVVRQATPEVSDGEGQDNLTLNLDLLQKTAAYYQARQEVFVRIISGSGTNAEDPSL